MKQKRRSHSPEFKVRIALEAIRGVKKVQQIGADNRLSGQRRYPATFQRWASMKQGTSPSAFFVPASMNYVVEVSNDLVTWTSAATNPGTVGSLVQSVDEAALPGQTRRFARLRVSQ